MPQLAGGVCQMQNCDILLAEVQKAAVDADERHTAAQDTHTAAEATKPLPAPA